ncbi:uncharacterized protein [Nicotiana sylvestris]|uniref:uncharacterized protein n=1 Tax=Nicotiana sylvestris TaxID=4096 RepID=UPI00388CA987
MELLEGYKPPKFEIFDRTGDPKVHLRTYCDKLMGVGKDERIRMKLFMRSLTEDALSWYIIQNPKKWTNWVSMASDFMDRFRFNTENAPDVFYIQNLKKKPTETFCKYATRWRSEEAKVRLALDEEQMNKFFVRAHDPQYYERLMATNKALQSGTISKKKEVGAKPRRNFDRKPPRKYTTIAEPINQLYERLKDVGYVTPISAMTMENSSQWVIQAKKAVPNVRNNPLPNHRGEWINVIESDEEWDPQGSIGFIKEGNDPKKPAVTLNPIVVQVQPSVEVTVSVPFEVEVTPHAATPVPFEVEVTTPFTVIVATTPPFKSNAIPWDYVAEARRKGKVKIEESGAAQGMTRTGKIYTPKNLGGSSKEAATKQPIIKIGPDDLWRKVQEREYSVVDHLNKTPAHISILSLLENSKAHKNALIKVLNEAYVPNNITSGEMTNMVGQVLESHKITFHKDELPPEGLSHNRALHIMVQFKDKFIARVLIDGGSSLNICPLTTLKRLGKDFREILAGSMNVKAFHRT